MADSQFLKSFDVILNDILNDYSNLDSQPDTTQGSMVYIAASVKSAAIWGLYKYIDYVLKQHFPDSADLEYLKRWAAVLGVTVTSNDTEAEIRNNVLDFMRQPPAGGNAKDFRVWALDETNSYYTVGDITYYNKYVSVVENADGVGTVGIYTIPNDETIVNNGANTYEEDLRSATETYIESKRPLGLLSVSVYSSDPQTENVAITVTAPSGGTVNTATIQAAIEAEMDTMVPGESLHHSTLIHICMLNGAATAVVTTPAAVETTCDNDEYIRHGTVTIT